MIRPVGTGGDADRLADLLLRTRADRVTLRLDVSGMNYPCIAEARGAGVPSIAGDDSLDQRGAATARWVARHRRVLVQPDVVAVDPAPPAELLAAYGVRAQMLAPVLHAGGVQGWVSVHSLTARPWADDEVEAARDCADAIATELPRWYGTTWARPDQPPLPPYGPL